MMSVLMPTGRSTLWTVELRARAKAAGYGGVLIGRCSVEGTDEQGNSLCLNAHERGNRLYRGGSAYGEPEIWAILRELGIPMSSGACHTRCFDLREMTPEQLAPIKYRKRAWVSERWYDTHHQHCPKRTNRYSDCMNECAEIARVAAINLPLELLA